MVKIRLRRVGAKKKPQYRLVAADSRSPRDGITGESKARKELIETGTTAKPEESKKKAKASVTEEPET